MDGIGRNGADMLDGMGRSPSESSAPGAEASSRSNGRSPEDEVVPGVRWGQSGWLLSPAYWAAAVRDAAPCDDYVRRDGASLHHELAFCLLGGFGVRMEVNVAAFAACRDRGLLEPGVQPGASDIEAVLLQRLEVAGRLVRYRFPHQRARRLSEALRAIEDSPPPTTTTRGFRDALLAIPGVGPKTASWIARNWLGADDVAILDIHVMRAGAAMNLFPESAKLPRDYEELEARFLDFARAIGVRPSLLDAVIWREMRA